MTPTTSTTGPIMLPPGVSISPGRETVQVGPNGQNVQGMLFTLTLPNQAVTSVFVPYTQMADLTAVQQMFADRVAQVLAVTSLGT